MDDCGSDKNNGGGGGGEGGVAEVMIMRVVVHIVVEMRYVGVGGGDVEMPKILELVISLMAVVGVVVKVEWCCGWR